MLKFISTLFYIVFVTILVGVGGLLIGTMLPIPGNIEMKIVKSGSMEPSIPTGAVVMVKPQTTYGFNDVITFGKDTKTDVPTTHRIVGVEGEGANATYITKGDANEENDPQPVQKREVIGKVVFSLPYAGFVLDFARQPIGFVLLIAIPAGLVILEEILAIFREATKGRRRRKDDGGTPAGGGGSGGEPISHKTLDLRGAPRIVYSRLRMMDEILVPMLEDMSESFRERMNARYRPAPKQQSALSAWLHADAYGTSTALTVGLVFMSTIFAGANGGTVAYFQDIERSMENMFGAGERWEAEAIAALEALQLEEDTLLARSAFTEGEVLGEADGTTEGEETPEVPAEEPKEEPVDVPEGAPEGEEESAHTPVYEPQNDPENDPQNAPETDSGESAQTPVNEPIPEAVPETPAEE